MKNPTPLFLLAFSLCVLTSPCLAEKADRQKPTVIQSDLQFLDDLKQTSIFTGNAIVTRGTLVLRGVRIELREDPQGLRSIVVTGAPGQGAFFRQKREGLDEYFEAQADKIEYDERADTVKLIQNAELRRLRGAKLADQTFGALIVYNNTSEQYTVNGHLSGVANANTNGRGRVRTVLAPPPATSAPATPKEPTPTPQLRSSPRLSGDNQ